MTLRQRFIAPACVAFAVLFTAGCAGESGPVGHLQLPGQKGTEYRVTVDGISDARVNVSRVEKGKTFRGVIDNKLEIEIRAEGDALKGERAGAPIDMKIEKKTDAVTLVRGMYGGKLATFHVVHEPRAACAYRYDDREEGKPESCFTEPQAVSIPVEILGLPIDEQAALIAVAFYR
jgi:hypothetical protein